VHGFTSLDDYLAAGCQQPTSPAQVAKELGTTDGVVRRLLDHAHLAPPPRHVTAAHQLRRTTDHQLTTRAADLGFESLYAYLVDRALTRRWPSTAIAGELGVHQGTVRDRLDQFGLPRRRASARPRQSSERQLATWAAKRQARLTPLGFADVDGYLQARRAAQSWSVRRMAVELHVAPTWLKRQMNRLGIR